LDKASTDDDYFANVCFIVARVLIVALVFVCDQLVHAVVVAILYNAVGDLTYCWSNLCAPVVPVVIAKVYFSFLLVAAKDFD
jgi:hypothetical protein